jgi:hypothetical protein
MQVYMDNMSPAQRSLLNDMRVLMNECLDGARRRDPPEAWQARLDRIAELSRRLELVQMQPMSRSDPSK